LFEGMAQTVAIIGAVCEHDRAGLDLVQHVLGRAADLPVALKLTEAGPRTKRILGLVRSGNDQISFARNTLAPLIKPGMNVYAELRRDIFGR
ncbi:MAG: hypothetical protein QM659_15310, partial [Rhodomicrobium sp.]